MKFQKLIEHKTILKRFSTSTWIIFTKYTKETLKKLASYIMWNAEDSVLNECHLYVLCGVVRLVVFS